MRAVIYLWHQLLCQLLTSVVVEGGQGGPDVSQESDHGVEQRGEVGPCVPHHLVLLTLGQPPTTVFKLLTQFYHFHHT